MTTLKCPTCGAEMDMSVCLANHALKKAYDDMLKCFSEADLLHRYIMLFKPAKNDMRADREAKLINTLLPCIMTQSITHQGREWVVPHEVWRSGFNAMLAKAEAGKISLPLTSHGYLFTILADLASKLEAAAEKQREEERRHPRRSTTSAGLVHAGHYPIDPELAKIKGTVPDPIPAAIKDQLNKLKGN